MHAITFIQLKYLLNDYSTIRMKCNPADHLADMNTVLLCDGFCTKDREDNPYLRKDEDLIHAETSHCIRLFGNSTETTLP